MHAVMNHLKETMINPVEEKSLMSISNGKTATDKMKESLDKANSMGKEPMQHFISCRLITLE